MVNVNLIPSKILKTLAVLPFLLALIFSNSALASDHGHEEGAAKEFDAGEMIMHHIQDSHEWHIIGDVALYLPIIAYEPGKGLSVFSSSHLYHDEGRYQGYKLDHEHLIVVDEMGEPIMVSELVENEEGQMVEELSHSPVYDLSITKNVLALLVSIALLLWIMLAVAKGYKRRAGQAPKGIQAAIEPIIVFIRDDIARPSIGDKKFEKFMPFLLTIFFFIWINNIMGLIPIIPGGANVTGNIAIPLVLALFTFVITNINGNKHYWRHIFAMPGIPIPVLIILTPIEIAQILIRPIVLVIRLFANIMAGHIGMLVFFSLIFIFGKAGESMIGGYGAAVPSIAFTIFLFFLELLVAAIQAYVFTLLSAIYFGMAVHEDHH